MLEGLDAAEENFSVMVKKERLDSNFAAFPNRRVLKKILETQNWKTLGEVVNYISSGHTPYLYDVKSDGDIGFITVECISDLKLHFDRLKSITKEHFDNEFKNNRLVKHSVCCTIKRRICKAFPVTKDFGALAFNQDISFFLPKTEIINPVYLATYLCSNIGQSFAFRQMTEQMNPYISISNLKSLPIVVLSMPFQNRIASIFEAAQEDIEKSNLLYNSAEIFLIETIGFKDFEPSTDSVNVKGFKESFLTTGRLDAEYYQKKYEDYLELIRSYPKGCEELQISCNQKDSNFTPNDNIEYKYIELADIGKSGEIVGCTIAFGIELPSRARRKVNANDVVISSIEGSLDSCALVTEEYNNSLCSTGFYIINSKKINSETLLVLFKSEPMQKILKQNCSGTILTAINKNEFQKIPVPLIDKSVQESIKAKLTESFRLKNQSEQLLETAKRAVEVAIEQDEEAAMKYIEMKNLK